MTLEALITSITSVFTVVFSLINQVLDLVTTHPVMLMFLGIGITAIGLKIGFRYLQKSKQLAN